MLHFLGFDEVLIEKFQHDENRKNNIIIKNHTFEIESSEKCQNISCLLILTFSRAMEEVIAFFDLFYTKTSKDSWTLFSSHFLSITCYAYESLS